MQTATSQNLQSAMTEYVLHQRPEYLIYRMGNTTYKSYLNGQTFVLGSFGAWIPTSGCPAPEKLPMANFLAFLTRNARWVPAALMGCILIVLTHIALLITDGAEFAAVWIQMFSSAMNTTLVILALLTLIAWAIAQFKNGLVIDLDMGMTKELAAASTEALSIAPDVAVLSMSEDESQEVYNSRVKAAIEAGSAWVLILPFQSEYGAIHTGGSSEQSEGHVFLRSMPPHDGGDVITFQEASQAKSVYVRERWADYCAYCVEFVKRYNDWAPTAKLHDGLNPLSVILKRATVFVFALCMAFAGTAQKSAQVRSYLGEMRYNQDTPTGEVDFVFRQRVYTRVATGTKTWAQLLTGAPGYSDADSDGDFVGCSIDGKPVLPVSKKQTAQAKMSAVDVPGETPTLPQTKGFFESLPDSSELAVMKRQNIMERRQQWVKVEPVLEYLMWRFWNLMFLLMGVGGLLWIFAKASATDAIHDLSGYPLIGNAITWLHISTKTILFLILCIPTAAILLSDVIRYYYTQDFSLFWMFKYAIICWAWYWAFQKIIPNSPGGAGPISRMGNYPANNNQRFLN